MSAQLLPAETPPGAAEFREMISALMHTAVRQDEEADAAAERQEVQRVEIAEFRRVLEALRASEAQFASIFNQTTGGIVEADLRGRFVLVNDRFCQIAGRSREELMGLGVQDVTHPDDSGDCVEKIEAVVAGRLPSFVIEKRYLRPDGSVLWAQADVAAIRDAQGRVRSLAAAITDLSERHAVEQALRDRTADLVRADRSKDEFLAQLAHELRNPLAPLSWIVMLLRESADPAETAEHCDVLERQIAQLVRLVEDLLDVSRIGEGKIDLHRETCDLTRPLRAAIESNRPAMSAAGHQFEARWPDAPLEVDGDCARLTQIFVNLLNNAVKYSTPGGRITLDLRREGAEAVVRVQDTGYGIAAEKLPHIFELFTQAHQDGRARGGLGIGLNLVQRLIALHGGSIAVESTLGIGSLFTARLPLAAAAR